MKKNGIFKSFRCAFAGLWTLLKSERNAKIHCLAAILVVASGFFFHISTHEWFAIIFAIGSVFTAEAFNSAIERLSDVISPGWNSLIGQAKDLAAAAVLVSAIAAAAAGLIIFIPKIAEMII